MREYDEDDYNIWRYELQRVIISVVIIIAVLVMMWPITNIFRSYVERPTPTIPAFDPDRGQSSSEASQAEQSAPAPLLTDAARTAAGDGLASLPDPNSGSVKGPLALPPGNAPPPAASPTGLAETAPNAPAAAPGADVAVTDSARSAATAETASSEAVSPEAIEGRDRLTATGPATGSMRWVGPIPLPRVRPVDTPPVPSSPLSDSPLFANPAPYGGPGADSAH